MPKCFLADVRDSVSSAVGPLGLGERSQPLAASAYPALGYRSPWGRRCPLTHNYVSPMEVSNLPQEKQRCSLPRSRSRMSIRLNATLW